MKSKGLKRAILILSIGLVVVVCTCTVGIVQRILLGIDPLSVNRSLAFQRLEGDWYFTNAEGSLICPSPSSDPNNFDFVSEVWDNSPHFVVVRIDCDKGDFQFVEKRYEVIYLQECRIESMTIQEFDLKKGTLIPSEMIGLSPREWAKMLKSEQTKRVNDEGCVWSGITTYRIR